MESRYVLALLDLRSENVRRACVSAPCEKHSRPRRYLKPKRSLAIYYTIRVRRARVLNEMNKMFVYYLYPLRYCYKKNYRIYWILYKALPNPISVKLNSEY